MQVSDELKMTVGKALGKIPSGVFILTAGQGAGASAMMASWVQQAAFVPPMVSVAMGKERGMGKVIREQKLFALSVLGEHDHVLMKKYARGFAPGEDPFAGVHTIDAANGLKVLADAMAYLECRLSSVCEFGGDHEIIVAEVTGGKLLREGKSFVHLRGSGFHY